MINIYTARTEMFSEKDIEKLSVLGKSLAKKISETKNEKLKQERCSLYNLLVLALKDMKKEVYDLSFDNAGRPFFVNGGVDISLSHADGAVFVAISDGCRISVGLDAERISPEKIMTAERAFSRYMGDKCDFGENSLNEQIPSLYLYDNGVFIRREVSCNKKEELSSLDKWCCTEAALKCEGGGFASLTSIRPVLSKMSLTSVILAIGGQKYTLALVLMSYKEKINEE